MNFPNILINHYKIGKRAFIIKARGSGTAPLAWKNQLKILSKDSGDVNLRKYAAGLDPGYPTVD